MERPPQTDTPFEPWRGFVDKELSSEWHDKLTKMARDARGHILKMTAIAGSGHPGGSMSSIESYLMVYTQAKVDPTNPYRDDRDRIIVSHGHTSPGAYAGLAAAGFFDIYPCLHGFRQGGSPFEGHVEQSVPGIEWDTGNLGQGLSAGVGKAIYGQLSGQDFHTYVLMGDGEQQKGQISEARRAAVKFNLRISALIDYNRLQISGGVADIMPQDIIAGWKSDGWDVIEVDGHNLNEVYSALHCATHATERPVMVFAHTIMGKGVSFMENREKFHGVALKPDEARDAFKELGGIEDDLDQLMARRKQGPPPIFNRPPRLFPKVHTGQPKTYPTDVSMDNRSAFGNALLDVADVNMERDEFKMGVFDCDLTGSVKTAQFAKKYPDSFYQMGIAEHHTATASGSLSAEHAIAVWADFGVFGIDETYNQARLNDINHANLKLFCTHCGVNVGEDGKTHQAIDYFALLNSTFGWKVITPADPNQCDRVTRYVLSNPGSFAVIMGRAKTPIIADENGDPFFGDNYEYRYGRMDVVREGKDIALVSAGNMLAQALDAWIKLNDEGRRVSLVTVSDWSDLHDDDLKMLASYTHVVTLEDHNVKTGLGSSIATGMFQRDLTTKLIMMGVHRYGSSGKPPELYKLLGIDGDGVAQRIREIG